MPKPIRFLLGGAIDLGILYQVYMGLLAVFCTNVLGHCLCKARPSPPPTHFYCWLLVQAINIYAGINGLEVTQSVIIGCAIIVHNLWELSMGEAAIASNHLFSLLLITPFVAVSMALLHHNTYPSAVFVGDTYTYFAGMTFAVVGILGHFRSPFAFSPAPFSVCMHDPYLICVMFVAKLCCCSSSPKFSISSFRYHSSLVMCRARGTACLCTCAAYTLPSPHHTTHLLDSAVHSINEATGLLVGQSSNWNLLNVFLRLTGPMHERTLNVALGALQVACCALGFFIRYEVSSWFF